MDAHEASCARKIRYHHGVLLNPFSLLLPYEDELQTALLVKEDNVASDADITRVTGAQSVVSLHQMHGRNVVRVDVPSSRTLQADGLITDQARLTLTIRFADCQGFIVYAPQKRVLGLLHVGWRGLIAGAIPSFFKVLKKEWGVNGSEAIVCAGPSLCTTCAGFTDPHKEVPALAPYFHEKNVNLIAAADAQLESAGVCAANIERIADCTRCMPEKYWSYRGGDLEDVKRGFVNCFAATLLR